MSGDPPRDMPYAHLAEQIETLRAEIRGLKMRLADLERRTSPAVLAHTKLGG
jgi:hypothetical protein